VNREIPQARINTTEKNGRHDWTPYSVNFEVTNLNLSPPSFSANDRLEKGMHTKTLQRQSSPKQEMCIWVAAIILNNLAKNCYYFSQGAFGE